MQRKKVDNRIRIQIENGVAERHRTLFVIVGDRGKDQVMYSHELDVHCTCLYQRKMSLNQRLTSPSKKEKSQKKM